MKEHDLVKLKISDLKFDKSNPNQLTREQMAALRESMQRFGYLTPIVVDQDLNIADGEHRALIYKEFGLDEIPAFKLNLKDDTERRMLRQVMNKLHGEHDKQLDADELVKIFEGNRLEDLSKMIAAQQDDLKRLINRYHPEIAFANPEDFEQINEDEFNKMVPDTQLGDIYELGEHRLMCADNSDGRSIKKLLNGNKVAQLNTDPPYGVLYGEKNAMLNRIYGGNRIEEQYENDEIDFDYRELFNNLFKNIDWEEHNTFYIWSAGYHLHAIRMAIEDSGLKLGDYLVWVKNNHVLGRKDYNGKHEFCIYGWKDKHKFYGGFRTTVLNYDKPLVNDLHPTMKPIELIKQTVTDGTQQGDVVLDVFAGSGSCLIACEQTNRRCFAMEIDPRYCDVIIKRWEKYIGKKAVKHT